MSHSVDEHYQVYTRTLRKARKAHKCCGCKQTIGTGDYYTYVTTVFDGSVEHYKRCPACESMFNALVAKFHADGNWEEWPDEDLNCGHEWEENHGAPPPEHVAALAFLSPEQKNALPDVDAVCAIAKLTGRWLKYAQGATYAFDPVGPPLTTASSAS